MVLIFQLPNRMLPGVERGSVRLLDALTLNRTRTIRVEVRESDGTVFTDIIHTTRPIMSTHMPATPSTPAPVSQRARRGRIPQLLELGGAGFIPGEDITVALTISSAESDARGVVRALIDLAQLAEYATEVLLIGNISGRIITEQLPWKPTNRQAGALGDELTNIMIAALIGVFALALVLRAAGTITAFIMRSDPPQVGIAGGVNVLFTPGHPGTALGTEDLNSFAYWMVTAIMLSVLGTVTVWVWSLWRRHSRKIDTDPRRLVGVATTHEVHTAASAKSLLRRAGTLRPSLEHPTPADIGYLLGQSRGKDVWASVEDSILLIGPPRSGKGLHMVIPAILDAPGAVVTTSTRPDNLTATLRARERIGPVMVFDPNTSPTALPQGYDDRQFAGARIRSPQ